ncbi:hypothetical protein BH10BAC2_BH10BAC2_29660 [soil metagenome]
MTGNQFDDLLRTRLEGHISKVPDDMWQCINKKDKDRKVFFFLRWQMLLLLLFIGLGGTYFFLKTDNNNIADTNAVKHSETTDHEKNKNGQNKNKAVLQNAFTGKDQLTNQNSLQPDAIKTPENIKQKKIKQVYNTYNQQNDATINADTKKNTKITNDFSVITGNSGTSADSLKDMLVKTADTFKKDSVEVSDSEEKKDPDANERDMDKFSIEVYASPNLPLNHISADNSIYEQALKAAGKMQFSYTFGARLGVKINKNLSGKIGVQYAQINEKMNFTDSILSGGNVSYNNRYKSIDIPLLISYKRKWTGDESTSFSTGILLNITSKYKGAIPDAFGDAININSKNVYKKNTGVSLYAAIGFSKEINKKMELFAEPYFRYPIKSMSNNIQPFTQKINTAGISLGVRYRLFKADKDQ